MLSPKIVEKEFIDLTFQDPPSQKLFIIEELLLINVVTTPTKLPIKHHNAKDCPKAIIIKSAIITKRNGFLTAFLIFSLFIKPILKSLVPSAKKP